MAFAAVPFRTKVPSTTLKYTTLHSSCNCCNCDSLGVGVSLEPIVVTSLLKRPRSTVAIRTLNLTRRCHCQHHRTVLWVQYSQSWGSSESCNTQSINDSNGSLEAHVRHATARDDRAATATAKAEQQYLCVERTSEDVGYYFSIYSRVCMYVRSSHIAEYGSTG